MPASMMSADAGASPKVNGSSIATVVSGEMPGSTPSSVPIIRPAKQNSRFCQVAAVARPSARLSNNSTRSSPEPERQAETLDEQQRRERCHHQAEHDELEPAHGRRRRAGHHDGSDA